MISYHVISYHIRHIISCHIISYHIIAFHFISFHVLSDASIHLSNRAHICSTTINSESIFEKKTSYLPTSMFQSVPLTEDATQDFQNAPGSWTASLVASVEGGRALLLVGLGLLAIQLNIVNHRETSRDEPCKANQKWNLVCMELLRILGSPVVHSNHHQFSDWLTSLFLFHGILDLRSLVLLCATGELLHTKTGGVSSQPIVGWDLCDDPYATFHYTKRKQAGN